MAENAIVNAQTLFDLLASLNARMEELAAAGEWDEVASVLVKRNAMLRELDGADKSEALSAARNSTDFVTSLARKARAEIGEKLAQLQVGKEAADTYRANTA